MNHMVEVADKLALGDIYVDIECTYKDEMGKLGNSFRVLANAIKEQTHLVKRMAEGDFSMSVEIRSEKDTFGIALNRMIEKINDLLSNIVIASE
ncbi:HAMP domain-containing protein [Tepidimicrobium xylanilyticum]